MSCILMGHFYVGRLPSLSCQPLEVDPMWYLAYTDYLLWEVTGEINSSALGDSTRYDDIHVQFQNIGG